MIQFGMIVVLLGVIALIYGIMQKMRAGRVADAPYVRTGDAAKRGAEVASPRGAVSAEGTVVCPQPLTAPMSGTPCLYYKLVCTARWKDGNTEKSKEIDTQKVAARFSIDDGSGPVVIDASRGGDFEPMQSKTDTKGTGLIGGLTGTEIAFGNYKVSAGMLSLGTKYTVREDVFPLVPRVYACGKSENGAIGSPSWRQLVLDKRSRAEVLASATQNAKRFLIGGAVAFTLGSGLAIVGQVLAPPPSADAPHLTAATSTTASAATPAGSSAPEPATSPAIPAAPPATTAHFTPKPPASTAAAHAAPKPSAH
jgi:hypothetical protein